MTQKRINQRRTDFEKALKRLKDVLKEDPQKTEAIIDATIQRFEFTFELGWKLAKEILNFKGIDANSPRNTIKEAFKDKLIEDAIQWYRFLRGHLWKGALN